MKKIILIVTALIIIAAILLAIPILKDVNGSSSGEDVTITIESGATLSEIADTLKENGVIRYPAFFKMFSKSRYEDYKFGEYIINTGASYEQIAEKISSTKNDATKITIPEGTEIYKIEGILSQKGIESDFLNTANDIYQNEKDNYDFLKNLPERDNPLEGYLFPDTYNLSKENTAENLIHSMLNEFENKWKDEYDKQAKKLNMTQDEIIILASVIEREAASAEEMPKVSSVFHNRLSSKDYPYLQSCATVQYILKERKAVLSEADTKIKSPYNTYINKGLPVGPICSPGEEAIRAALYPDDTDYYFFVLGKDGKTIFSKTYQEHQQAMRENGL